MALTFSHFEINVASSTLVVILKTVMESCQKIFTTLKGFSLASGKASIWTTGTA